MNKKNKGKCLNLNIERLIPYLLRMEYIFFLYANETFPESKCFYFSIFRQLLECTILLVYVERRKVIFFMGGN